MDKNKIQMHWRNFLVILFIMFLLGFLIGFLVWYQTNGEKTTEENTIVKFIPEEKNDTGIPPPRLIRRIRPVYPEKAQKYHIQGIVILEAMININGKVEKVKVLRSFDPILKRSAEQALWMWEYEPMKIDNKPQKFITKVFFNFKLKKNKRKFPLLGII